VELRRRDRSRTAPRNTARHDNIEDSTPEQRPPRNVRATTVKMS